MTGATPKNSVWSAMNYAPPRGRCNFKSSLMSPACSCLRFMLHPVKAATSFECDGCQHHASFHSLENPSEDAVLKKWEAQEDEGSHKQALAGASKKRKRISNKLRDDTEDLERITELSDGTNGEVDANLEAQLQGQSVQTRAKSGRKGLT